ncbi:MAG: BLUF domain-containing protein [Polynucleobacter sp.]
MLIQSVYTSAAMQPMPKSKLYKILVDSRVNNKLADVTGLLVYVDGNFLQVLEGEQEVVTALLEKISKDRRHKDVKVVYKTSIENRTFNSWQMAYISPSPRELATWAGLKNTTTLESTFETLEREPNRFPSVLSKLLLEIPEKDLEPG